VAIDIGWTVRGSRVLSRPIGSGVKTISFSLPLLGVQKGVESCLGQEDKALLRAPVRDQ
jgi:hypothetical protein